VSKKKHRVQNEYYDLDMAYITQRVMAMGYPSTGCESLYRNKLNDIIGFLNRYHRDYKVYNLCMESGRIYSKEYFNGKKVALFPFLDHEPCPIKLMLEFCTDLVLYLLSSDGGVAAVHCKAGKGRTGVMIISYLIFSGLCENSAQAARHYGRQRTDNNKVSKYIVIIIIIIYIM
jgi:phosphatidylinositol-3,4,5-trisphosphate 3-phosphatase/dual-specificity protein phosphatase PTEN